MKRIGVFVCWCGHNIAGTVDVKKVVDSIQSYPGVVFATDYLYVCSEPGQELIRKAIKEQKLDSVVVSSCSPTLHEMTFRRTCAAAGLNPFQCEIANIREQVSWVTDDKEQATRKAIKIIKTLIEKVRLNESLTPIGVPVTKRALVIGAGVAGIQAALDIANSGHEVILLEKEPSIGGHMAQLSETFPTLDCSQCILTPKMVEARQHEKIKLLTYGELEEISGYVGNFKVKIKKKSRYVDETKCNGCGECALVCPVEVDSEFEQNMAKRKAIYRPFPQAVPNIFTIDKKGKPPCRVACPAGVNAQGYIALITAGKYKEALALERETNPFPSVCGRVCNHPCEGECSRKDVDQPVAIASLKRFIADYELKAGRDLPTPVEKNKFKKVAIVGSGPAGLTAAYYLAQAGYPVTVFEALPVVGGMLVTGIPEFRLPRAALNGDIDYIKALGIDIKTNSPIGKNLTLTDLRGQGYSAIFLGIGAHKSLKLGVEGEDLAGVLHCVEFLRDVNLGKKVAIGSRVAVVGGGNAAIDSARTALRLGAKEVFIVYRRSRREMPARDEEIEEAEHEGIKIHYLAAPTKVIGTAGRVSAMECIKMELGPPDASGRRRPLSVAGSEFTIEVDTIIPAISQAPDLSFLGKDSSFEITKWDTIVVDPETLQTSVDGVFAGGDAVSGPATVIEAIAGGKIAAESIERYLSGRDLKENRQSSKDEMAKPTPTELSQAKKQSRTKMQQLATADRMNFKEVDLGYEEEAAKDEARRCLNCGICSECMECVRICAPNAIDHAMEEKTEEFDVGSIVVATGFELYSKTAVGEYGYGKYPDVIDGLQFERLLSASGPTAGQILRPSDGTVPKTVVFVECVGSRDPEKGIPYCSKICCMYTAKHALLYKHNVHDGQPIVFYMDVRAGGKGYEEFVQRAIEEESILYVRGRVSRIFKDGNKMMVWGADTLTGKKVEVAADLVVLATAIQPSATAVELAKKLKISVDEFGFFSEAHPKLRPVETLSAGFYLAGVAQAPKDIPEAVAQASAAASKVAELFSKTELLHEPLVAGVDEDLCSGCAVCVPVCPYNARQLDAEKKTVKLTEVLCEGCGACTAACPSGAAQLKNLSDRQVEKMIEASLKD